MTITKKQEGSKLTLELDGRLDTATAQQLESELNQSIDDVTELILQFEKLVYISSAGLRVILLAQKRMSKQGSMIVKQVNENILEVLEMTGFASILTIESTTE